MAAAEGIDQLVSLVEAGDTFEAVERICARAGAEQAMNDFMQLAKVLFWQRRNLQSSAAVARAGIQFGLCFSGDADQRVLLRGKAKALAFNLAANTWPGWGDEGIVITSSDLAVGLDAARLNLRLAVELGKPALAQSLAHWALGAHRLARGEHDLATRDFELAERHARTAENADHTSLNAGYAALVGALLGDEERSAVFTGVITRLSEPSSSEDAKLFAKQLVKAREIFEACAGGSVGGPPSEAA
jgi:hypothetical protein